MTPSCTMRHALSDPRLLGKALVGPSWTAWKILLMAACGEALTDAERIIFKKFTGRDHEPGTLVEVLAIIAGRRAGKDRAISILIAYLTGLVSWDDVKAPGETLVALLLAPDQRQARISQSYIAAVFEGSAVLKQSIASHAGDALLLTNGISIEVRAASARRLRGPTYLLVALTEIAHFVDDGINSADIILDAVTPGLSTTRGPLLMFSSPWSKRGALYDTFKRDYGPAGDPQTLVIQAASRDLNPTLSKSVVDKALAKNREMARSEYLGLWQEGLSTFLTAAQLNPCIAEDRFEIGPDSKSKFFATADPSSGTGSSFTLAIARKNGDEVELCVLRERRAPFSPDAVVEEYAQLLARYGVTEIHGDKWGLGFHTDAWKRHGITYKAADKSTSDSYGDFAPLVASKRVTLLNHDRLIAQLLSLESRTGTSGRTLVGPPPKTLDDLACVCAAACVRASAASSYLPYEAWVSDDDERLGPGEYRDEAGDLWVSFNRPNPVLNAMLYRHRFG
jgi:hypothetical protein